MSSNNNPLLTTLSKTNNVISTTLHSTITSHTTSSKQYNAKKDSLDYLSVKNGIMISYLIDLTLLLRYRLEAKQPSTTTESSDTDDSISEDKKKEIEQLQTRLLEQRTLLTKIRPLEKKLRYQIDKLLALSTLGAGTFAARDTEDVERIGGDGKKSGDGMRGGDVEGEESADPLSFKPDLQGMMKMFENVDDEEQNDDDTKSDDGSDVSEDEETSSFKPKIALEEDDDDANTEGIYQPPRHQAVPFELDNERALLKAERLLQKQRDRLSRSELTQVIKSQFTDAPEEEDVRGGALLGKQSEASRKLAQQDAAQQELEESHMIRFTVGKKEKKLRTKMRRDELSNLNVISGGFGTVGAGIDDAFGNDNDDSGDDMLSGVKRKKSRKSSSDRYTPQDGGEGSYKMKGMRKRKVEVLNDGGSSSKRGGSGKKKKGATNTYQKSLYGGSGGGGGSKSSKRR